jgi:hypothetical protein
MLRGSEAQASFIDPASPKRRRRVAKQGNRQLAIASGVGLCSLCAKRWRSCRVDEHACGEEDKVAAKPHVPGRDVQGSYIEMLRAETEHLQLRAFAASSKMYFADSAQGKPKKPRHLVRSGDSRRPFPLVVDGRSCLTTVETPIAYSQFRLKLGRDRKRGTGGGESRFADGRSPRRSVGALYDDDHAGSRRATRSHIGRGAGGLPAGPGALASGGNQLTLAQWQQQTRAEANSFTRKKPRLVELPCCLNGSSLSPPAWQ